MKISEARKSNSNNGVNGLSFSGKGNGVLSNGHEANGKSNGSHN